MDSTAPTYSIDNVDMGEGESVKVHGVRVHVELVIGTQCHGVAERIGIIDFLFHVQIARQDVNSDLLFLQGHSCEDT